MWYLIVSIPDLCTLTYLKVHEKLWGVTAIEIVNDLYIVYRSIHRGHNRSVYISAITLRNIREIEDLT